MYIDHLKRGAGGVLSHDEGYFGSQEGFCALQKWPRDHTVYVRTYVARSIVSVTYSDEGEWYCD